MPFLRADNDFEPVARAPVRTKPIRKTRKATKDDTSGTDSSTPAAPTSTKDADSRSPHAMTDKAKVRSKRTEIVENATETPKGEDNDLANSGVTEAKEDEAHGTKPSKTKKKSKRSEEIEVVDDTTVHVGVEAPADTAEKHVSSDAAGDTKKARAKEKAERRQRKEPDNDAQKHTEAVGGVNDAGVVVDAIPVGDEIAQPAIDDLDGSKPERVRKVKGEKGVRKKRKPKVSADAEESAVKESEDANHGKAAQIFDKDTIGAPDTGKALSISADGGADDISENVHTNNSSAADDAATQQNQSWADNGNTDEGWGQTEGWDESNSVDTQSNTIAEGEEKDENGVGTSSTDGTTQHPSEEDESLQMQSMSMDKDGQEHVLENGHPGADTVTAQEGTDAGTRSEEQPTGIEESYAEDDGWAQDAGGWDEAESFEPIQPAEGSTQVDDSTIQTDTFPESVNNETVEDDQAMVEEAGRVGEGEQQADLSHADVVKKEATEMEVNADGSASQEGIIEGAIRGADVGNEINGDDSDVHEDAKQEQAAESAENQDDIHQGNEPFEPEEVESVQDGGQHSEKPQDEDSEVGKVVRTGGKNEVADVEDEPVVEVGHVEGEAEFNNDDAAQDTETQGDAVEQEEGYVEPGEGHLDHGEQYAVATTLDKQEQYTEEQENYIGGHHEQNVYTDQQGELAEANGGYAGEQGEYAEEQGDYSEDRADEQSEYIDAQGDYTEGQGEYVDEQGEYVEEQGEYVEEQGEYVEEQGEYIEEQRGYVEEQGGYVEEQGEYMEERSEYAEEQGEYVEEQGEYAEEQGEYVDEHGGYVNGNSGYAEEQGEDAVAATDYTNETYAEHTQDDGSQLGADSTEYQEDPNSTHGNRTLESQISRGDEGREQQVINLSMEVGVLQDRNQELEELNEQLMAKINTLSGTIYELRDSNNSLQTEYNKAEKARKQAAKSARGTAELEELMAEKDEEIEGLIAEGTKLSQQMHVKDTAIKKLREKNKELETHLGKTQKSMDEKDVYLAKTTAEKNTATEQLATSVARVNQLEKDIGPLRHELSTAKQNLESSERIIQNLNDKLEAFRIEVDNVRREGEDRVRAIEEKAMTEQMGVSEDVTAQYEKQIDTGKEAIELLQAQIETLEHAHSVKESEWDEVRRRVELEADELRDQLQEQENRVEDLTTELVVSAAPLNKQIESLRASLAEHQEELLLVERSYAERLSEADAKLSEALQNEDNFARRMDEASENVAHLTSVLTDEREQHELKLNKAVAKQRELQSEFDQEKERANAEITRLENEKLKQISLSEHRMEESVSRVEELEKQNGVYAAQIGELKAELVEMETELQQHTNRKSQPSSPLERAKSLRREFSGDGSHLASPSIKVTSTGEELGRLNTDTLNNWEQLKGALHQREREVVSLQGQIQEETSLRVAMEEEVTALVAEIQELQVFKGKVDELQTAYEAMNQKYEKMLQMYGQKAEEAEEARLDLLDIKEMYKDQTNHLIMQISDLEAKVAAAR